MTEAQRVFQLQRIYTKDISFEVPGAPEIFLKQFQPKIDVNLNTSVKKLEESSDYDVTLSLTVTASADDKTVYLVEIKQSGIFNIVGIEGDELDQLLHAYCPSLIFPYAREVISDLITRGTFPQLLLQPINFEAAYVEARRQAQEREQSQSSPSVN